VVSAAQSLFAACESYVTSRQCPDAGFCFYRAWGVEESNPADTCAAIASLRLLSADIPRRDAVVRWLRATQLADGRFPSPTVAWYALDALRHLDEVLRADPRPYLHECVARLVPWLDADLSPSAALLELARLVESCLGEGVALASAARDIAASNVRSLRSGNGGYGRPQPNLIDTDCAVAVLFMLDLPAADGPLREFLSRCEDPEQGFRLVPDGSGGSLASTRAGLRLCTHLGAQVPARAAAGSRRFALACRTSNGGFGRSPGAIPTLDDTRFALEILLDQNLATQRR